MPDVPDTEENAERCVCRDCPSFPGAGALFCGRGRSEREVERVSCSCASCANFDEHGLRLGYYCEIGSAAFEDRFD